MKAVKLQPLDTTVHLVTGAKLVDGLLAKALKVGMACGGRGLCATCHVFVRQGAEKVTPHTERELRTLKLITTRDADSRLACQCSVQEEGIVVEVPAGMYVRSAEELMALVGEEAEKDYLHPINGSVLIPRGKLITRTMLKVFHTVSEELRKLQDMT